MRSSMSSTTAWYSVACSRVSVQNSFISILSGRSAMIVRSVFSRRSTNGAVMRRSCAAASSSPSRSIGMAKRSRKDFSEPSRPGLRNCMIDHSSARRFSTGVPVMAIRRSAGMARTLWVVRAAAVLDLLRLVEDQAPPGDGGEELLVARGQAVGRQHQVRLLGLPGERPAVEPIGPVVHVHRQVRGEARRLALPVADERHRADDEGRAGGTGGTGPLVDQQGEELRRLPEPHVVGQAGPEAEVAEEGQPPEAALLVGTELPGEPIRGGQGLQPAVLGPGQEVPEPAVGLHLGDGQGAPAVGDRHEAQCGAQDLAGGHPGRGALPPDGRDRRLDVPLAQLHPLAAHPDQRLLEARQRAQLGEIQPVVAERDLPTDVAQAVQPDGRGRRPAGGAGLGLEAKAQPGPGRAPPGRRQDPEAGLLQERRPFVEERQHAGGVGHLLRGRRRRQRRAERGDEPGREPEAAQEQLVGVRDVAFQGGELGAVGPYGRGRDEQAGVVHRLERELDPPVVRPGRLAGGGLAPGSGADLGRHRHRPRRRSVCRSPRRRSRRRQSGAGCGSRCAPLRRPCPPWHARRAAPRRATPRRRVRRGRRGRPDRQGRPARSGRPARPRRHRPSMGGAGARVVAWREADRPRSGASARRSRSTCRSAPHRAAPGGPTPCRAGGPRRPCRHT